MHSGFPWYMFDRYGADETKSGLQAAKKQKYDRRGVNNNGGWFDYPETIAKKHNTRMHGYLRNDSGDSDVKCVVGG